MTESRIYLDNAATSWPKPAAVYDAVDHYHRHLGAPAGRGVYREAIEIERLVADTRLGLARLIGAVTPRGVTDPQRIVFTCNGTDALNLALHGALRAGDHVITSVLEHNSVLRPLRFLEHNDVAVTRVGVGGSGILDPDDVRSAVRPNTRLIALTHVSNVTGAIQPVAAVGAIAGETGLLFLLDAAQSLGHLPVDVGLLGVHLLAAPGHKGLLGPLGCGFLYLAPGLEQIVSSTRQGGTGTHSESDSQPNALPDKYEAGNLNVPAIVGLNAALRYLADRQVADIRRHDQELLRVALASLREVPGIDVIAPLDSELQVGVLSIRVAGYDPQELATVLDAAYSVQVRAGLHCAPLTHRALGTEHLGGTVRLSWGPFTTVEDIQAATRALTELARAAI